MAYTTVFFDWGGVIADDPGDDFLEKILIECGADESQRREIFATYMKDFMAGKISESEYWDILRQKFKLPIDSSISARFMDWVGLKANTEVIGFIKPQKEIYNIALERLGAKAEQCIFIDDKDKCLVPARAMGFQTIQARSTEQFLKELEQAL